MLKFGYFNDKNEPFVDFLKILLLFLGKVIVKHGELYNRFGNVSRADAIF